MNVLALHIPDGFLSLPVAGLAWILTIVSVGLALRQTRRLFGERQIPLIGVLAAFIFAAQMINFPVIGGTSGHLLGGALAAIVLGPWPAVVVMTSVIFIQALVFQDGGLIAIGANTLNMGLITIFVGYAAYQFVRSTMQNRSFVHWLAPSVAAWLSVMAAALATSLQLAISGTAPLGVVLPAMLGVHVLIGIGEALITVGALAFIQQTRPDFLEDPAQAATRGSRWIGVGLLMALLVVLISPLASPEPDGLERVALNLEAQGQFSATHQGMTAPAVLPDYTVPFIQDSALSTIVAGALGVMLLVAMLYLLLRLVRRSSSKEAAS